METKQELIKRIDRLVEDYNGLLEKHGHGVRPSYVSADLGTLGFRIEKAREQLELIVIETPCDEWSGGYGEGQL